jgi:hypothetical protein
MYVHVLVCYSMSWHIVNGPASLGAGRLTYASSDANPVVLAILLEVSGCRSTFGQLVSELEPRRLA